MVGGGGCMLLGEPIIDERGIFFKRAKTINIKCFIRYNLKLVRLKTFHYNKIYLKFYLNILLEVELKSVSQSNFVKFEKSVSQVSQVCQ